MAAALPTLAHDPIFAALDHAPLGAPLTPEQEAEVAQAEDDLRAGRVKGVPHAEVQRAIEQMRRQQGG